jgi:CRP-like cAMP-binding protein
MRRHIAKWLARARKPVRATAGVAGGAAGAYVILVVGDAAIGSARVVDVIAMLIAIPVIGFTLNQVTLTNKGRKVASTVEEVQVLKQSDAIAFTQLFAAVIRRLPARHVYPEHHVLTTREVRTYPDREAGMLADSREQQQDMRGAALAASPGESPTASTLWDCLTELERQDLMKVASCQTFAPDFPLWHQGDLANHVAVIRSGQVAVFLENEAGKRIIAIRGPGDVVGERAALRIGIRSAAVVAVGAVEALLIKTEDSATFLAGHQRVVQILENQIYRRLTEDQSERLQGEMDAAFPSAARGTRQSWTGQNCTVCLIDISDFSSSARDDQDRMIMRSAMYRILKDVFDSGGVSWDACYREDRGDGVLILIPPRIPTCTVVNAVVSRAAAALRQHNDNVGDARNIRLRVAVNVGPVTADPEGISGSIINEAARFIEAPALKKGMVEGAADLGFATSDFVYKTVIRQTAGPAVFGRFLRIKFQAKKSKYVAWIYLSDRVNARG